MQRKNTNKPTTSTSSKTAAKKNVAITTKATLKDSSVKETVKEKVVETMAAVKEAASADSKFSSEQKKRKNTAPMLLLGLSVLILGLLAFTFRDKFLVATINGKPVFRYELNKMLVDSFGKATLENLIVEKLIEEEVSRQNVSVSKEEIDTEVDMLSESLGEGAKIEDVLAFQGISLEDFRHQLELRLQVNKIVEKEITVSEEEIDNYIKNNASYLVATDEAEKRAEATAVLREQKIGERIQTWISELLASAKITRYLK